MIIKFIQPLWPTPWEDLSLREQFSHLKFISNWLCHLESRWRNTHVLLYHGPLQIATFWQLCHLLSPRCNRWYFQFHPRFDPFPIRSSPGHCTERLQLHLFGSSFSVQRLAAESWQPFPPKARAEAPLLGGVFKEKVIDDIGWHKGRCFSPKSSASPFTPNTVFIFF